MKQNKLSGNWVLNIISFISFLGCAISYFFIDDKIGIHWNSQWQINNYVDKEYVFLLGAAPLIINIIFDFFYKTDPKHNKLSQNPKSSNRIRFILVVLMIMVSWMSVATGFSKDWNYKMIMPIALGIMFVLLGNYLPTVKRNYFMGIRTSWAMEDDVCWRKSNRFGGYMIAIYGLFLIAGGITQSKLINRLSFWFLLFGSCITCMYSYLVYRKVKGEVEKKEDFEKED